MATLDRGFYRISMASEELTPDIFNYLNEARLPIRYLVNLFTAGDEQIIQRIIKKLLAVRVSKRNQSRKRTNNTKMGDILAEVGMTIEEAKAIYKMNTLSTVEERFEIPPYRTV